VSPALTPSRGSAPAGNGWILHLQRATNKFCRKPEVGDKISSKVDQSRNMGAALANPQAMWAAAEVLSKPYLGWSNMARFSQGLFLMCSYPD